MPRVLSFFVHPNDRARALTLGLGSDPWAFRSEIDHGLLQPYLVARAAGLPVELVSRVDPGADDGARLVVHARQIANDPTLRAAVHAAAARVVLVRGSATGEMPSHREMVEVVSDLGARAIPRAAPGPRIEIPPLPQIGIVTRDETRASRVERVVIKGWRVHQPPYVGAALAQELARLGLALDLAMEDAEGRKRWHDFAAADVVLALRSADVLGPDGETGKPPTRLVNAWVAGAIPIVSPEAVYLRVGRAGEDMLVVDDEASLLAALARLCADADFAGSLFAASRARGASFAWDVTAARYVAFFTSLLG